MKLSSILVGGSLYSMATAAQPGMTVPIRRTAASATGPPLPIVPGYNFTMPLDHFTSSDTRTYSNQYFVNDTYYKAGGPVILFDVGESEFEPGFRSEIMAEYNGTISAPIRLAARLNGMVIGWEHRFYGYSQPFPVNETTGLSLGGAAGYKYLTVEQGLEDLVYFANRFNTTVLSRNSVIKSTANLDPYHTPWIHFGGSYTGARAAWSRQRNPEIFYANWASSAPVQVQADNTYYYNPIARALPSNCTKDLHAIGAYVDQMLSSGVKTNIQAIQAGVYLMQPQYSSSMDITEAFSIPATSIYNIMKMAAVDNDYQTFGARQTIQVFCDYMESFDVQSYVNARAQLTTTATYRDIAFVGLQNRGGMKASANGIVADYGQNGPTLAFVAFTYAYLKYIGIYKQNFYASLQYPPYVPTRGQISQVSWTWQTIAQMGYYQYTNTTTTYFASMYENLAAFLTDIRGYFTSFKSSDIPTAPNTTYPMMFGGWNTKPSNVMFTNGEFDPWRALGVMSQETVAPSRKVTTTVPKCNTPPNGTDVFGILYKGAVHVEDLQISPALHRASEEAIKPVQQGVDLFVQAFNTWQPCFNASRDYIRNGKGVDGQGNSASGTSSSSPSSSSSSSNKNAASGFVRIDTYTAWTALILSAVSVIFSLM